MCIDPPLLHTFLGIQYVSSFNTIVIHLPLFTIFKMAAGKVDNLQEELLRTKKVHAFTTREVSILRTRIKILEKECKKKDQQIDDLLKDDVRLNILN